MNVSRRQALAGASALGLCLLAGGTAAIGAAGKSKPAMTMYRSAGCGCCLKWADLAKAEGYAVNVTNVDDIMTIKARAGVPESLASCHTVTVGGYVVEGHVPFAAVARLLRDRPKGVAGIAVPGMPAGTPGMEVPGEDHSKTKFDVTAFTAAGQTRPFAY